MRQNGNQTEKKCFLIPKNVSDLSCLALILSRSDHPLSLHVVEAFVECHNPLLVAGLLHRLDPVLIRFQLPVVVEHDQCLIYRQRLFQVTLSHSGDVSRANKHRAFGKKKSSFSVVVQKSLIACRLVSVTGLNKTIRGMITQLTGQ